MRAKTDEPADASKNRTGRDGTGRDGTGWGSNDSENNDRMRLTLPGMLRSI